MSAVAVSETYTDEDTIAAIATADIYLKNIGDTILGDLDFSGNQAVELVLELLASAPSGAEGRIYFDTETKKVYIYRGA